MRKALLIFAVFTCSMWAGIWAGLTLGLTLLFLIDLRRNG